jgi:transcription elongation factor GreB
VSRAFVDEDSGEDDGLLDIPLPLPPGARNYMTPEGAARLHDELRELTERGRPRALAALASAPDAEEARHRLHEIDRRVAYLGRMASLLAVTETPEEPERVAFGAWVELVDGEGRPELWRIVGADESDPGRGLLSWASPLSRALMGRKAGESVTARLPRGERRLRVISISGRDPAGSGGPPPRSDA